MFEKYARPGILSSSVHGGFLSRKYVRACLWLDHSESSQKVDPEKKAVCTNPTPDDLNPRAVAMSTDVVGRP